MAKKDDDPFQDPEWLAYAARAKRELVPMINDSAVSISLVPSDNIPDPKFAMELGYMIMLDKPIIAVLAKNSKPPAKLVAVADELVEGDINDPDFQTRLTAAISRLGNKGGFWKREQ